MESDALGQAIAGMSGPFALALIDRTKHRAILATDRFGIRPLYYACLPSGGLVFGTTAEGVRCHPAVGDTVDTQGIFDYLYFHVVPSPRTIYRDIRKLPPGHALCLESGRATVRRYWTPAFVDSDGQSLEDLSKGLKTAVWGAIRNCPLGPETGTFLSGGIDSSTISGVAQGLSGSPQQSFAIGFESAGYDEMAYARLAAKHFNLELNEYYVTPEDISAAIPRVARFCDEPFGNSSVIPAHLCAQLARSRGIKTLLAGDGGDEVFAGNARYAKQKLFDIYSRLPGPLRRVAQSLLETPAGGLPLARKMRSYVRQAAIPMPDRLETYNYLHHFDHARLFEPGFLNAVDTDAPISLLREIYESTPSKAMLNRMLYLDWRITLADNDLRKVNVACELADVQVQYPLLDDDVVAFSTMVPPSLKLKGFELRWFFKRAMSDFLPREIIRKSKHGFGLPFGEWLKTSPGLQEITYAYLTAFKSRGIIRPAFIDELIEIHKRDHAAYYGTMVWVVAMLEAWFQEHGVSP
jgi:asparagine synthase (glutamine-hydrolysing)